MKREVQVTGVDDLQIGDVVTGIYTSLYGVESTFTAEVYGGGLSRQNPHILGRSINDFQERVRPTKVEREFNLPEQQGSVCWIKTATVTQWTLAFLCHDYGMGRDIWRIPTATHQRNTRSTAAVTPEEVAEFKVVDTGTPIEVVNGDPGPVVDPATNTVRRVDAPAS